MQINFGSCPTKETGANVNKSNYKKRVLIELRALRNQLRREFGGEPEDCRMVPHLSFGEYYELVIECDDAESERYANRIKAAFPDYWDEDAIDELTEAGYTPR